MARTKPQQKTVWKTREVQVPCSPTQVGGTLDNPGLVACTTCGGRGYTTRTEHYPETEIEYVEDE